MGRDRGEEKYDWETYAHSDGDPNFCHDLGDIANTKHDVAHVKWGGNWRMPTIEQFEELLAYCNHEWTTLNGVKGRKFTSKLNGNSIFLPAAGSRNYDYLNNIGSRGYYWLSTQYLLRSDHAYNLLFRSGGVNRHLGYRGSGRTVRPVSKN